MRRKTLLIGCGIILLWTFLPLISVFSASMIASAWDCQLDEGGVHPCVVLGRDIGELLNSMFVMGWFFFLTLPSGLLALIVLLVAALISARAKRKKQEAG